MQVNFRSTNGLPYVLKHSEEFVDRVRLVPGPNSPIVELAAQLLRTGLRSRRHSGSLARSTRLRALRLAQRDGHR